VYETFFGLQQKPFSLLPDPRYFFPSHSHKIAINLLEYGFSEQAGFVVLTGEVGTGKTTLLRHLLSTRRQEVVVGLVTNTHHSFGELMKWILSAFDLDFRGRDQVECHQIFVDFLIDSYAKGKRVVLIVDEAQNLGQEALEQLRMLSNVNAEADHLLQLILVGQPELRAMLQRRELRQFVQRISVDYHLEPLRRAELAQYVRHRLQLAGGEPGIFDAQACLAVHYFTGGLPRLVNSLCDYALVFAYAEGSRIVDVDIVIDAASERMQGGLVAFPRSPLERERAELLAEILEGA
jgi:type II secretory pathway predicted ATPase ExeA